MVHAAGASHIGACLSAADVLAVLYERVLRVEPAQPDWPDRDRFILSKGHAAAIVYAVLAERGFFPDEQLESYSRPGSLLTGHASHHVPGVELSTGSLGHGLPVGCGMALAAKREGKRARVFVLLGDGELAEGSNWEAILFAAHHRLDNLVAIVDCNNLQGFGSVKDVLDLAPLAAKWEAFGWSAAHVDGHDHEQIASAFGRLPLAPGQPSAVLARTVKGKGVRFMEGSLAWHYKSPNGEQLQEALDEIRHAA